MCLLARRFAVALTVIFALTFLLAGSSLADARARQALTGEETVTVRMDTVW